MHSTSKRPSLIGRRSRLPCMRWPLWPELWRLRRRLQRLQVVFAAATASVPLSLVGQRRLPPHRKAAVVRGRVAGVLHD
jgi:hypothetical protein